MGWFTNTLQALDKPSNAIQGYFVGGNREDETRFEGMMRGWNQEENYDFEQLWDEDLQKKGWSERDARGKRSYVASTLLNLVVDPLNALPIGSIMKGMGMMRAGMKAGANVEKGAMKGSMLSGIPNYIDEFYGPSAATTARANKMTARKTFDSPILMSANDTLSQPISVATYKGAEWVGGIAKTATEGAKNAIKTTASPENRALWRGDKINKEGMISKPVSPKGNEDIEYVHRALYQSHIAKQSGATGERQLSEQLMLKLGNRGYVPFKKGNYAEQAEGFHSVQKGSTGAATTEELNAMEDIIGNVWKDNKVPISKADNSQLFIKNDSGTVGGNHFGDMKRYLGKKGGELDVIQKAFDNPAVANMSLEELAEYLGKLTYTRPKNTGVGKFGKNLFSKQWWQDKVNAPRETYTPSIQIKDGNVWMNFSMAGSSITEGGVNVLSGFKPSGRMISAVSDEHNFLEKFIPNKINKYALPNRVVMITTPTIGNIKTMSLRASKRSAEPHIKGKIYNWNKEKRVKAIMDDNPVAKLNDYKTMVKELQTAKAKPADLLYEQGRQLRAYGVGGAGLFAIPSDSQN